MNLEIDLNLFWLFLYLLFLFPEIIYIWFIFLFILKKIKALMPRMSGNDIFWKNKTPRAAFLKCKTIVFLLKSYWIGCLLSNFDEFYYQSLPLWVVLRFENIMIIWWYIWKIMFSSCLKTICQCIFYMALLFKCKRWNHKSTKNRVEYIIRKAFSKHVT